MNTATQNITRNIITEDSRKPAAFVWMSFTVLSVFVLVANLFWMTPFFAQKLSVGASSFIYLTLRVVTFIAFGFALTRFAKRTRYQTLSTVMLVALLDQVVIKAIQIQMDQKANPEIWAQMDVSTQAIWVGLGTGFLFFAPVVLVLGFLGVELGRIKKS